MKTRTLLFTSLSLMLLLAAAAAAPKQQEHALKVGKKGEITLTRPTKVGDIVLQPDTYVVQHRVSGGNHFVRFVELKTAYSGSPDWPAYPEQRNAGEIKCRLEPATGPMKDTTAYLVTEGSTQRITQVAIKGETVLHVF